MELHQIVIRPQASSVIILFEDAAGNKSSIVYNSAGNATVDALLAECRRRLPAESENPAKAEIQREIASLEGRLGQLKAAIGAA